MRGGNAETSYLAEVREVSSGIHDMQLCHIEFKSFNRMARQEPQLFEMMNDEDWVTFMQPITPNDWFRTHSATLDRPSIFICSIECLQQYASKATNKIDRTIQMAALYT